jgi:cysteinyl-tRNA synthetase
MVKMIQTLIDKGNAYVTSGREGREVLFAVSSMPDYGKLSNRRLDEQQAGARIAVEDHKRNPADFVLWKESAADEPGWDGSFTENGETLTIHGRPGWHIECSVMSEHHLGETFDIHGGGLDLIFPHHENEIAQSCCAHGNDRMANLWMHNGFLQVEGRKMSKSEGNFVTIAELLETEKFGGRKWPGEVLRLAMLMTHYREPIDFSVKRLEEAENTLRKWKRQADRAVFDTNVPNDFVDALSNDLGTLQAFFRLSELASATTVSASDLAGSEAGYADIDGDPVLTEIALQAAAELKAALLFLGFSFEESLLSDQEIVEAVDARLAFIAAKNWAEADRIRDELLAKGIQLKDGKDPETGERVTTWEVRR